MKHYFKSLLLMAILFFNMTASISIGAIQTDKITSVHIKQDIRQLSDTAKITLPRKAYVSTQGKVNSLEEKNLLDVLNVGDVVTVALGYDDDNQTEFQGYVSNLGADAPLVIECEDEMWQLKQTNYNHLFESVSLAELLSFIAPNYDYEIIDDISLGKFLIENESAYDVFMRLKNEYLLYSYFVGKTLTVGFASSISPAIRHTYHNTKNVKDASRLKFVRAADVRKQIKAISINKDGSKETVSVGTSGGVTRTLHYQDKTKEQLKVLAQSAFDSLSFDGLQGTVKGFGLPRVRAGESLHYIDPNDLHKEGVYIVESVGIQFSKSTGFQRVVKPYKKIL